MPRSPRNPVSRRGFLALGAAAGALAVPRWGSAGPEETERKFIFVFCPGGWDPTFVFAPLLDNPNVDMEAEAQAVEVGGITYVGHEDRTSVTGFFDRWADRSALIHGVEFRSVAHDVCRRIAMTGSTLPARDDWASIIAHHSSGDLLLPMVHASGPSYSHRYGASVVRLGQRGQLGRLADGRALADSTPAFLSPSAPVLALEDAYALARAEARAAVASRGRATEILRDAARVEGNLGDVVRLAEELELGGGVNLGSSLGSISEMVSRGTTRCGVVGYDGVLNLGWDTHGTNSVQSGHFEELFEALDQLLLDLDGAPGHRGTLLDDTTIVVMSEMGRYPRLNASGGKEHWTFSSCMLLGGGIAGSRVIGGYDADMGGRPVDLASGEVSDGGTRLVPGHLGATLLALADIDPAEYVLESPILGLLA